MDRLAKDILPKWQKLGLVKDVIVTQSNLNDATQIQQMRQLVDQGVDAIIVCCSNPTALNQTVKYAYERGVPTFSLTGYLTSPYAVNSSSTISSPATRSASGWPKRSARRAMCWWSRASPEPRLRLAEPRRPRRSCGLSRREGRRQHRRHVDRPGGTGRSAEVALPPIPASSTASPSSRQPKWACSARCSNRAGR